jgi:hypothetical protein
MVRLNATVTAVLELCDGHRTIDEIIVILASRYVGDRVGTEARELIAGLSTRGLALDADS